MEMLWLLLALFSWEPSFQAATHWELVLVVLRVPPFHDLQFLHRRLATILPLTTPLPASSVRSEAVDALY